MHLTGLKVRPKQYYSYIKKHSHELENSLKGEFYEFYCYNELLKNEENIKIVRANNVQRKIKGDFIHCLDCKIHYTSRGVRIAEFDALGIKSDVIYWWEITRSRKQEVGFEKKYALLKRLFPNYKLNYCLIKPFNDESNLPSHHKIIPEPDYQNYFNDGYFQFDKKIKNCISLHDFEKKSTKYDYFDDLISFSFDYYNNKNIGTVENLKK